jgi:hypothetical protein
VLVDGHQRFGSCDTGGLAHKALRLPPVKHQSVMKESDITGPAAAEVRKRFWRCEWIRKHLNHSCCGKASPLGKRELDTLG